MSTPNPKLNKKDFLKDLAAFADATRRTIESRVSGFSNAPADIQKRRKAAVCFETFAQIYFPHYVTGLKSVLHEYLYERLENVKGDGAKIAVAAPRGEAKSTIVSLIFVLWCVCFNRKHFIVIMMDAWEQVAPMVEAIKAELEFNPRLILDFPDAAGKGTLWREGVIVTKNSIKIQGFGSGKRLRGVRHGAFRPDLCILDDIENDENVRSPAQRDKLYNWVVKAVLKLGPTDDSMDVVYIGTILHYDSVLNRILKNKLWETRKFRAIMRWPDRMDLWEEWETVLLNDGPTEAETFYNNHVAEMEAGAVVSWPAQRPLKKLMTLRARDGHESFDSELQNDPINNENASFTNFIFWTDVCPVWTFFGACDPSLGKTNKHNDPSAVLIGGLDRSTGKMDIVEALIRRRVPDLIISDMIALQQQYNCVMWFIEAVQFQEFLRTELMNRAAAAGIYLPASPIIPHADKVLRIESLQPPVSSGLIRFRQEQSVLLEQMRHFPKGDHDDGPDCLHMLYTNALKFSRPAEIRLGRPLSARSMLKGFNDR